MSGLKNKVIVITGGSSGIGAATALEFAKYGVKLVLTGRDKNKLLTITEQCLNNGAIEVEAVSSDLSTEEGVKAIAKATLERFGTVHVLVNNAGGGIPYTLHYPDLRSSQGNPVSVDYCYSLMVRAPWQLSGLFVDELIKNKELGRYGVRVNAVLPGSTHTYLTASYGFTRAKCIRTLKDYAKKAHLLEQEILQPTDIAKAMVFLASDDAKRITGVLLPVDGGAMLSTPLYDFTDKPTAAEYRKAKL
ncbi:hypothetical protein LSH36_260g05084 [Paralvinella palmiformis]|uniref:Uncharacterized protein n=1 Tax=Paralvinella palmiformis TaxID=53620 RepID=A0AAD9N2G4_9ANNE|nr:hypothetical protein LSH36_260g05084 [Paralvinella palmiformis]